MRRWVRFGLVGLLATGCVAEAPPRPGEGILEREWIGTGTALDAGADDVAVSGPWAAVAAGGGVQLWWRHPHTGVWAPSQLLGAPPGAEGFGTALALDAGRLVVTAPGEDHSGATDAGAAYVYDECGLRWCVAGRLQATTPEDAGFFGTDDGVALDGDRIVVGARVEGASDSGAAYVFDRDPTGTGCGEPWCATQRLVATGEPASAWFGHFVDLDGDRLAVGAYAEDAAYVFDRDPTGSVCGDPWCPSQRLVGSQVAAGDGFGIVALDGDRLVVGAALDDNAGAAYVFDRDPAAACGATWCESDRIASPGGAGESFGFSMDLVGDLLAVSRRGASPEGETNAGEIHLYEYRDLAWQPSGTVAPDVPVAGAYFGSRLDLDPGGLAAAGLGSDAWWFSLSPRGNGVLVDPSAGLVALDDVFVAGEFPVFSAGVNDGFGGAVGDGSRLYVDSGECGGLVFGFARGLGALNDQVVIYIDSEDGGFASTAGFTDVADPLRKAISGTSGGPDALLEFAPGFLADHALAFDASFAGLWRLVEGDSHEFLGAVNGAGPSATDDDWAEMGLGLADLGLSPGDSFDYVVTYIAGDSAQRSNELHGVEPDHAPGNNPVHQALTLQDGDFLRFVSAAPVFAFAEPDQADVDEGGEVSVAVLDNDDDPSGVDTDSLVVVTDPTHGTATVQGDGTIRYVHDDSETTGDAFAYRIADACGGLSDPVDVAVTVLPVDDPPGWTVADVVWEPDEDIALEITGTSLADLDSGTLTVTLSTGRGTLTLASTSGLTILDGADGTSSMQVQGDLAALLAALDTLTYQGLPDLFGADTITLEAEDDTVSTPVVATIAVDVQPVNDPPEVAVNAGLSVAEGEGHVLLPTELSGADVDDLDGALRFEVLDPPQHGLLLLDGAARTVGDDFTLLALRYGDVVYAHDGNESGTDAFEVQLFDDDDASAPAVTVDVTVTPVDDPPRAVLDTYATDEDVVIDVDALAGVLANDSDPEGDPLVAVLQDDVGSGTLVLDGDGSFRFTPAANRSGTVSFSYLASANGQQSDTVSVTLTVVAVNDAPLAVADDYVVDGGSVLEVDAEHGLLANDYDVEGDDLRASVDLGPAKGALFVNADGSFAYTPDAGFSGTDTFTYLAADGAALSLPGTVTLEVSPTDTGDTADTADPDDPPGCGCQTSPAPTALLLLLPPLLATRRRRGVRT